MPPPADRGDGDRSNPPAGGRTLRVRMYNVGFGDAFLLFLPTDDGPRTMLVDCGVHPYGVRNRISLVVKDILETVTAATGSRRLDVVVATHRHADHISGFALRAWNDVDVGEVWLPWTEDRSDPEAARIREAQRRLALQLRGVFGTSRGRAGWLTMNSLSNADAERTLLRGFRTCELRRFLPDRLRNRRSFRATSLPGITVHALGPSHDPDLIAALRPPPGSYFPSAPRPGAGGAADEATTPPPPLFDERFWITPDAYRSRFPDLHGDAQMKELRQRAQVDLLGAASALEDAINGTSLVIALDFGEVCVLLPGDAEWGTWSEILNDDGWSSVLRRTMLYKVSHHGSYNGTPPQFVELLPPSATSMVSLRAMQQWPSIPRTSLLQALSGDGRTLLRSDDTPDEDGGVRRHPDGLWIEADIPV